MEQTFEFGEPITFVIPPYTTPVVGTFIENDPNRQGWVIVEANNGIRLSIKASHQTLESLVKKLQKAQQ